MMPIGSSSVYITPPPSAMLPSSYTQHNGHVSPIVSSALNLDGNLHQSSASPNSLQQRTYQHDFSESSQHLSGLMGYPLGVDDDCAPHSLLPVSHFGKQRNDFTYLNHNNNHLPAGPTSAGSAAIGEAYRAITDPYGLGSSEAYCPSGVNSYTRVSYPRQSLIKSEYSWIPFFIDMISLFELCWLDAIVRNYLFGLSLLRSSNERTSYFLGNNT